MKGKKRVGIDIDGCLAYMLGTIKSEAERMFGITFDLKDVKRFGLEYNGLSREQIQEIIHDWDILKGLPEIPFAKEALEILWEDHEIHLVTARREESLFPTMEWLRDHEMEHDHLGIGKDVKAKYVEEYGLEWFVEDRYKNALAVAEVCETVYLINKTYNEGRPVPDNVIRVNGWQEILGSIYED